MSLSRKISLLFCDRHVLGALLWSVSITLAGCQSSGSIPVEEFTQPPSEWLSSHRVSTGETLYSIAWQYNLDTSELADLNGLAEPYSIRSGQKLALDRTAATKLGISRKSSRTKALSTASKNSDYKQSSYKSDTKQAKRKKRTKILASASSRPSGWMWPTRGKLLASYSAKNTRKGLAIGGTKGQSIVATTDGTVVYAGDGLPALGKLLIVKHGGDYLSAYAHNDRLLVSKGQRVSVGQKIAELGNSGTGTKVNQLHFEIRYKGKAVNPLALLPKTG